MLFSSFCFFLACFNFYIVIVINIFLSHNLNNENTDTGIDNHVSCTVCVTDNVINHKKANTMEWKVL